MKDLNKAAFNSTRLPDFNICVAFKSIVVVTLSLTLNKYLLTRGVNFME